MRLPWRRAPSADSGRWVMVDVESSGLDPRRDALLAIAALALRPSGERLLVDPGDSFEVVLQQPGPAPDLRPDKANILVHGIGVGEQRAGVPAAQALAAFLHYADGAPLIAFHAGFDRALIERALRELALPHPPLRWLDLADLAPVLRPGLQARALDEWLAAYGIAVARRHQAASDTWASAELMQALWPLVRAQRAGGDFASLARLASARRWVGG